MHVALLRTRIEKWIRLLVCNSTAMHIRLYRVYVRTSEHATSRGLMVDAHRWGLTDSALCIYIDRSTDTEKQIRIPIEPQLSITYQGV